MDEKEQRIVAARLALRDRFKARAARTPSRADARPLGSGPPNRHGMPKLPVGQSVTTKWPVLDLGRHPEVPRERWRLTVDGAVEEPVTLAWADLLALPQVEDVSDFHCVTGWSQMDLRFGGVRLADLLALARPQEGASHLMLHGYDGYSTNVALEEALEDDVLVAHTVNGAPLPVEHGGPARVVTPRLYAWKGAKWVNRVEVMKGDRPGYWEERGYSDTARPWRDDRYR
ncbi:sulfite oxidase-like oxidoreductase [Anaeromyxobacter diazotrophicus]|uniref:Sulfite oxidase-like oxidoreductase n=1 Tax=Anaeromyxobacter diazotrophicus TaxID=2590199 RepID=A0A7I9VQ26_9BACT|nr:sulfite oxidase-like oxidoreductase [Anaeromyxobacter diazotrophicus]GEJ58512.1 sulfite oxidase-like oxidoreductase [Anaeromyxobacter diazotrophicus]